MALDCRNTQSGRELSQAFFVRMTKLTTLTGSYKFAYLWTAIVTMSPAASAADWGTMIPVRDALRCRRDIVGRVRNRTRVSRRRWSLAVLTSP